MKVRVAIRLLLDDGWFQVARRRGVMRTFVIVIERGENSSAYAPEVPGCVATGSTEKEAEANMIGALELHLTGMNEDGLLVKSRDVVGRRVHVATG